MMNYKETLFFIGKCLSISFEKEQLKTVTKLIKTNKVDWELFTKIGSNHYVIPALYCNLKRVKLLEFIPNELINLMKDVTDANRTRNLQLITQAKELNHILLQHHIKPIFIKGSALLLQEIYEDIAERMLGDIDLIIAPKDFDKTIDIVLQSGYKKVVERTYKEPYYKHFPRLHHPNKIGAIEIHKELTREGYHKEFNYKSIAKDRIRIGGVHFMSLENQLSLAIIAKQINDGGQFLNTMSLRNGYDVFLLAQKTASLKAIEPHYKMFHPLNNFLAITKLVFNSNTIVFQNTKSSHRYCKKFDRLVSNPKTLAKHIKKTQFKIGWNIRLKFILKAFTRKSHRIWIYHRICDQAWRQEKLKQLRFKPRS